MSELSNLGLSELEWRKHSDQTYEAPWNPAVDNHNDQIVIAYRAGVTAALADVKSDEYHAIHYSAICLWGHGERCRAASEGMRMLIARRKKALLPEMP